MNIIPAPRTLLFSAFFAAGLAAPLVGETVTARLQLESVERDRVNLPVVAEISIPETIRSFAPDLQGGDGAPRAVQIDVESTESGRNALIYWVEPDVPGGTAPEFTLTLEPREDRQIESVEFRFEYGPDFQDLFLGERPVYRYVTVHDPERHADTHKPYHHVYDFHGRGFITKGPGGLFPHHKGIYAGWNQVRLASGDVHDFWHARHDYQHHAEYLHEREAAGPVFARSASSTDWITHKGETVIRDIREVTTWKLADDMIMLDYLITIEPLKGDVFLGGDAHHAGFQFRASQEVAENAHETVIIAPEQAESHPNEIWSNAPWMAISFNIQESPYTVVHMDHNRNPAPTTYSTRNYGRFGAFFVSPVAEGEPVGLRYRILVINTRGTDMVSPNAIAAMHADYLEPPVVSIVTLQ